ncbi:hypothetical protein SprV_0301083600 [Sparganum proliferum]
MHYILCLFYLNVFASAFFTGENRCPSYLDALSPLNAQHLLSLPPQTLRTFQKKTIVVLYHCGMTDDVGQQNGRRGDNVQAIVQLKYEANNTLILLPNVKIGRRTQPRTGAQVQFENINEEFEQDSVLSYVFSKRPSQGCQLSDVSSHP